MKNNSELNVYFQKLLNGFVEQFHTYKDKKIVLYGIGAFSATVIEQLPDYQIIGLMDRDPDNIGKILYGKPILSKDEVEKQADLIIINTEAGYWQTIFKRISDIKLEVFYRNGQQAYLENKSKCDSELKYWNTSKQELMNEIEKHSIISFDIFDTLITRKIYLPADLFQLMEWRIRYDWEMELAFTELRTRALHTTGLIEPTFDEIYMQFQKLSGLAEETVEKIKQLEIQLEKQLLVPRAEMIKVFQYAKKRNKKVILVSDMYYSSKQLEELLIALNITGQEKIFVSCEYRKSKQSGALWEEVFGEYKRTELLHIGDNMQADYTCVKEKGADAFFIMAGRELLQHSSIRCIIPYICTILDSVIIGTIIAQELNSPFSLSETKGMLYFKAPKQFGYSVFAPLIFGFTHWLMKATMRDHVQKLLFFARDGYFLQHYYEQMQLYCKQNMDTECEYFMISRRLAAAASIKDNNTFLEVARLPYKGTFSEYMERRWNVKINPDDEWSNTCINTSIGFEKILQHMERYEQQLKDSIRQDSINFKRHCIKAVKNKKIAVVDTWYYGSCQWYFSQILGHPVQGYYFGANLSQENRNNGYNSLSACYNDQSDMTGQKVNCLRNSLHFESIFTAPHGMVRSCLGEDFIYEKKGKNQEQFELREEIHLGSMQFMNDIMQIIGSKVLLNAKFTYSFCDQLYGAYWNEGILLSKEISGKLYNENYFQSSEEFLILE